MLPFPLRGRTIPALTSCAIRSSSQRTLKRSSANIPTSGSTMSPSGRLQPKLGMRALAVSALAMIFAAATSFAAALNPAETAALIEEMKEHRSRFPSLTADFTEEKTSRLLQKPLITSGTIAFTAPNLFRREIKGSNPSTTVCDGSELWIYYPNFNEAEHYSLGKHSFFDDSLAALTAGLNFSSIGQFYHE